MEKKAKNDAKRKPVLRLRRRSLADLTEESLSEVVGGHTCQLSCRGSCPPADTCAQTCGEQHTCEETLCVDSVDNACPTDECMSYQRYECA